LSLVERTFGVEPSTFLADEHDVSLSFKQLAIPGLRLKSRGVPWDDRSNRRDSERFPSMLSMSLGLNSNALLKMLCIGAHCDDIEIGCGGPV
jgi:hypothetical protein